MANFPLDDENIFSELFDSRPEGGGSGGFIGPTPTPVVSPTSEAATFDERGPRRLNPCNPNPCAAGQLCVVNTNGQAACYDPNQTNYSGQCSVEAQNCDSGARCTEARRTTDVNSITGITTTTIFGVCQITSPTPTPTPPARPAGLCQNDAECREGFYCNFEGEPTFLGDDLTNPYYTCREKTKPFCNYTDQERLCASPAPNGPGLTGYTGTATRTVLVTDAAGRPLPLGCIADSRIDTSWNTSECNPPVPPACVYTTETVSCEIAKNEPGFWTGTATRQILDTTQSSGNCVQDPNIGVTGPWDFSACTSFVRTACRTFTQTSNCRDQLGEGYSTTQTLTRTRVFFDTRNRPDPIRCDINAALALQTEYDTSICTPPVGACNVVTQTSNCQDQLGAEYSATQLLTRRQIQVDVNNIPQPRRCNVTAAIPLTTDFDTSVCRPIDTPQRCTPPTVLTRTVDVACTSISSNFIGGTAQQQQVREYDSTAPGPETCPVGEWRNSGLPNTSTCQVVNTPPPIPTPQSPQIPQVCRAPNLPASRTVPVVCSQIDRKYTSGQAIQRQVLRVDTTQPGPGECPYNWENSGLPDVSSCVTPVFWRNCVTGQLVEGTPPADFQQTEFLGAGGGTCWEPLTDLAFEPNLNEALRYSYQRGSSKYPTGRDIKVTNPSYGTSYKVTITTNSDITLSNRKKTGNKGTLSFTIAPRSSETFTVNITPTLLQALQDGLSTLSMAVEYQQVIT